MNNEPQRELIASFTMFPSPTALEKIEHADLSWPEFVASVPPSLMVDCSHANSSKQHDKQVDVAVDIAQQLAAGSRSIFGVMVESHLEAGAQKFTPGKDEVNKLVYGKSITDACLGWEPSQQVLAILSEAVRKRRA